MQTTNLSLRDPYFWDNIIKDAPVCIDLVNNFQHIKQEVLEFLNNPNALYDYPKYNVTYNQKTYELYDNYWKAVPISRFEKEYIDQNMNAEQFALYDMVVKNAKKRCPTIEKIIAPLEKDNNIANCFISRLIPGSVIHPHDGTSPHFMRVHLCIVEDPGCKITVGEETRAWQEGKLLAFKDGGPWLHSVKHEGTHERIVLSCDVRINPYLKPYMII